MEKVYKLTLSLDDISHAMDMLRHDKAYGAEIKGDTVVLYLNSFTPSRWFLFLGRLPTSDAEIDISSIAKEETRAKSVGFMSGLHLCKRLSSKDLSIA